ncbi:MAG: AraC family transcriptional regulator [Pseudomonadota bacterium]
MSFTSSILANLSMQSFRKNLPEFDDQLGELPDHYANAKSDADQKKQVLAFVFDRFGPVPILMVGRSIGSVAEMPPVEALLSSSTPTVLAEKWMRMEQYYHSNHRTQIKVNSTQFTCHRTTKSGADSHPAEDILIFGVLIGLLRLYGCEGVLGRMEPIIDDGQSPIKTIARPSDTKNWTVTWTSAPEPTPRLQHAAGRTDVPIDTLLKQMFMKDSARNWSIAEAARSVGRSSRSLQRDIKQTGHTFSSIVRAARSQQAGRLLSRTNWELAEIGFCCGYADQAHFQRDFCRALNMTPAEFRRLQSVEPRTD